jgi:hypothetical protein
LNPCLIRVLPSPHFQPAQDSILNLGNCSISLKITKVFLKFVTFFLMTSYWLLVALTELMMFELMSQYLYGDGVSYLSGVFVVTNQYVSN